MNTQRTTAVWQRGPIAGFAPELQPAVHALMEVAEEIEEHASSLTHEELWARPFSVASVGFHLLHLAGSTDRLLAYARGEALSDAQRDEFRAEKESLGPEVSASALVKRTQHAMIRAVEHVGATDPAMYQEVRYVGRARIPSTVWGLVFHAAEHASRHAGQLVTTIMVIRAHRAAP